MTTHYALLPRASAQAPLCLGIDVGGTNIKYGVVDDLGRPLCKGQIPTFEERGPVEAIGSVHAAVADMLADVGIAAQDVAAIGLATPGTMDIPRGMLLEPHNLPHWFNVPIRQIVADRFGMPPSYANDANAAAYGEFWVGRGRQYHSIVLLTLGTGVGGGIIVGDLSIDGENSHGSECGHIIIDCNPNARPCPCGHRGHLEAYCSATALIKRTSELIAAGRKSSLAAMIDDDHHLTGLLIAQAAENGDSLANEVIDELATYLGFGIVSLMHTIDPGAVVLGGAMNFGGSDSPLGRKFLETVRSIVRQHAFPIPAQRTTIDFALLEGDAGFIGAAGIARLDRLQRLIRPGAQPAT
jgi:glucokinase